ncbi:Alginate export [Planctomycetales bacterium 10988]|nr:Alginate export [Planctomycetales bacterium 10988]
MKFFRIVLSSAGLAMMVQPVAWGQLTPPAPPQMEAASSARRVAPQTIHQPTYGYAEALEVDSTPAIPTAFGSECGCEPECETVGCDPTCESVGCDPAVGCGCCDEEKKKALAAAAAGAHKGVYYANDFSYLKDPCYKGSELGDSLKGMKINDWLTIDVGGEYRARFHSEQNMRGLGLTGRDDDFLLHRNRVYLNAKIGDRARFYAEYIDAVSFYEDFGPRPIEENRSDVLNFFADLTLLDDCKGKLIGRIGRQELLYGEQRLVSPLDWANTRRTFDGVKLMWQGKDWNVDGFWTRPVIVDTHNFDNPDNQQQFYGLWATYKGFENDQLDLYWLGYENSELSNFAVRNRTLGTFHYQTVGARYLAGKGPTQALLQGAYQFGQNDGENDHSAGFFVIGAGHKFEDVSWSPQVWLYYDWASGDADNLPYNQLFPLAHKYLGFMDFFSRSNIEDINATLALSPHKKVKLLAWYHLFYLQDGDDVAYNIVGRPISPVAGGSQYLGQELDLIAQYTFGPRSNIIFGYSHFFTGDWYETNPVASTGFTGDADFFYTQYTLQF